MFSSTECERVALGGAGGVEVGLAGLELDPRALELGLAGGDLVAGAADLLDRVRVSSRRL